MVEAEPTIERMERALLAWGAFRAGGGCGDGYPTTSVISPDWMPPASGMRASMPMPARSTMAERLLDFAIQALSVKLRDSLYVVYVKRASVAQRAVMLQCKPLTVDARVREAKRALASMGF